MPSRGRALPVSSAPVPIIVAITVRGIATKVAKTPVLTTAGRVTSIPMPSGRPRARSAVVPTCGRSSIMRVIRPWGSPSTVPIGRQRVTLVRLRYWRSCCRRRSISSCERLNNSSNLVCRQSLLDQLLDQSYLKSGRIGACGWHAGSYARHAIQQTSHAILSAIAGQRRSLRLRNEGQRRRVYGRDDRLRFCHERYAWLGSVQV